MNHRRVFLVTGVLVFALLSFSIANPSFTNIAYNTLRTVSYLNPMKTLKKIGLDGLAATTINSFIPGAGSALQVADTYLKKLTTTLKEKLAKAQITGTSTPSPPGANWAPASPQLVGANIPQPSRVQQGTIVISQPTVVTLPQTRPSPVVLPQTRPSPVTLPQTQSSPLALSQTQSSPLALGR